MVLLFTGKPYLPTACIADDFFHVHFRKLGNFQNDVCKQAISTDKQTVDQQIKRRPVLWLRKSEVIGAHTWSKAET